MTAVLAVAVGGAIGSVARYGCSLTFLRLFGGAFPYGTLFVNSIGGFFIAFFLALSIERIHIDETVRLFIVTGFLGGFTTFSSFSYETLSFLQAGQHLRAFTNIALNNMLAIAFAYLGLLAARAIQI